MQESVYKYELKIKDGDKAIEEDIEIDTEKQTETYHIPKKDSGNGGEVDILYDFKQVTDASNMCREHNVKRKFSDSHCANNKKKVSLLPIETFASKNMFWGSFIAQMSQAHVASVLRINLLSFKRVRVALQASVETCMRNKILRSANAKYHYFRLFFL